MVFKRIWLTCIVFCNVVVWIPNPNLIISISCRQKWTINSNVFPIMYWLCAYYSSRYVSTHRKRREHFNLPLQIHCKLIWRLMSGVQWSHKVKKEHSCVPPNFLWHCLQFTIISTYLLYAPSYFSVYTYMSIVHAIIIL